MYSQSSFDKFVSQEYVTAVVVNKKMFDLMSNVKVDVSDKETQRYMALLKKLENLKVFTTTNSKIGLDLKTTSDAYVKTVGLKDFLKVNQDGKDVRILIKSGSTADDINELLMFIDGGKGNETILLSLTGDFSLNEISLLTNKMKIPGGDELSKSTKK
jgi:hypothetical protein